MTESPQTNRRRFMTSMAGAAAFLGFVRPELARAASSDWVTVTATLTLDPDHADDAIAGLSELVAAVEAEEPGVLAYICNRGLQDRNEILFFEIYENQAAVQAHGQTEHMQSFRASAASYFVGQMKIVPYERVAGYHR